MAKLNTTAHLDKVSSEQQGSNSGVVTVPPTRAATVMLFVNNPQLGKDTLVADLTPPDYPGYAGSASITWNAPVREPDGSYSLHAPLVSFQVAGGDASVPVTIVGCGVVSGSDSTKLCGHAVFDSPVTVQHADEGFNLAIVINQGGDGSGSTVTVLQ